MPEPDSTGLAAQIESYLRALVGLPLSSSGRACDLQWFSFGALRIVPERRGGTREVGQYALHVQCAWRIRTPESILVASRDRYYPSGDPDSDDPDFDWDVQGANRCDEKVQGFLRDVCPLTVVAVLAEPVGDLRLELEDGWVIDIFPDNSLDEEHWRFFQPANESPHLVWAGGTLEGASGEVP